LITLNCKVDSTPVEDGTFTLILEPFNAAELIGFMNDRFRQGRSIASTDLVLFALQYVVDWRGVLSPNGLPRPFDWEVFRECFKENDSFAMAVMKSVESWLSEVCQ